MKQLHCFWLVCLIRFNSFDLPQLTTFTTGEKSFYNTIELNLTSLTDLIQLIWSSYIDQIYYRREFILLHKIIEFDWFDWFWFNSFDLPQLTTFTVGTWSFYETTSLNLTGLIDLIHLIWSSSINHIYYRREVIL